MQEISGSLSEVIRAYSDHNLLVPAATDVQLNPFYKYHVEEVAVDLSENSGDIFKVGSVKTGKTDSKGNDIWQDTYSLSKPLLNKLAMAAGIQFNPHQTSTLLPTVLTLKGVRLTSGGIITGVITSLAVGLPVFAYGSVLNSGPYKTLGSLLTVLLSGIIALAASGKERRYAR